MYISGRYCRARTVTHADVQAAGHCVGSWPPRRPSPASRPAACPPGAPRPYSCRAAGPAGRCSRPCLARRRAWRSQAGIAHRGTARWTRPRNRVGGSSAWLRLSQEVESFRDAVSLAIPRKRGDQVGLGRVEIKASRVDGLRKHVGDLIGCTGAEAGAGAQQELARCVAWINTHSQHGDAANQILEQLACQYPAGGRFGRLQQKQQTAARLCREGIAARHETMRVYDAMPIAMATFENGAQFLFILAVEVDGHPVAIQNAEIDQPVDCFEQRCRVAPTRVKRAGITDTQHSAGAWRRAEACRPIREFVGVKSVFHYPYR